MNGKKHTQKVKNYMFRTVDNLVKFWENLKYGLKPVLVVHRYTCINELVHFTPLRFGKGFEFTYNKYIYCKFNNMFCPSIALVLTISMVMRLIRALESSFFCVFTD